MLTGVLAKSGYYMGHNIYPPNLANPKGIFEDAHINNLNEELIKQFIKKRSRLYNLPWIGGVVKRVWSTKVPAAKQLWLAEMPRHVQFIVSDSMADRMRAQCSVEPYCFKDPRFTYTLPAWQPYLGDHMVICVFRHPNHTARSMLKEVDRMRSLRGLKLSYADALNIWECMYSHVLDNYRSSPNWMFVHFDQVLDLSALSAIEDFTGAHIDKSFPSKLIPGNTSDEEISTNNILYSRLCELANYNPGVA